MFIEISYPLLAALQIYRKISNNSKEFCSTHYTKSTLIKKSRLDTNAIDDPLTSISELMINFMVNLI